MILPHVAWGHDYGNAMVAGAAFQQQRRIGSISFPSVSAPGSTHDLERLREGMQLPVYRKEDYLLQFEGRETYLGFLAFESREASSAYGDINRYWSTRSLEALLVASAALLPYADYELFVVTGLPVETYTKENRALVKAALEGDHTFFLNGAPRRAIVHVSQVIMEGAGAIIAYGERDEVKQGAIDIGGRTTDLFATRGQLPRIELCHGKALGVELVGTHLNALIGEHLSGHSLAPEDIYRVLRTYVRQGNYPKLFAHGERITQGDLVTWIEQAITLVAKDIASFVSRTWHGSERSGKAASDFARVLLVGGGAYYFKEHLRSLVSHLVVPNEPELANAVGYAALATSLLPASSIRIA